jgi:hypothetical protein
MMIVVVSSSLLHILPVVFTVQVTRQEMYEKKHAEYESAIAEHNASASEKEMVLFRVKSNLDVLALQRELDHERGKREGIVVATTMITSLLHLCSLSQGFLFLFLFVLRFFS